MMMTRLSKNNKASFLEAFLFVQPRKTNIPKNGDRQKMRA